MSESDCIFCRIAASEIPSEKIYEDERIVAFEDINPISPTHFLVIPKEHIETLDDASPEHQELLGYMMLTAARIARNKGVSEAGYRQVINCRAEGGQIVFHLHLHIIGGRKMGIMG